MTNVKIIGQNLITNEVSIDFNMFGVHVEDWIPSKGNNIKVITRDNKSERKSYLKFVQKRTQLKNFTGYVAQSTIPRFSVGAGDNSLFFGKPRNKGRPKEHRTTTNESTIIWRSGCLIKSNEFVDIKYNVWVSVQKILQRAKCAAKHLRIREKRTIYFARLFA